MNDNRIRFTRRVGLLACCGVAATLYPSRGQAATIFDDGMANSVNSVLADTVEVRDSVDPLPTTLNIEAGAVIGIADEPSVSVFDTSTVNMTAGQLVDSLVAAGASNVSITGGVIGNDIVASDSATVTVNAPVQFEDDGDGDPTTMGDPIPTADDVSIGGAATVNFQAGYVDTVSMTGGVFNFSGGRIDDLASATGFSQVNISDTARVDDDAFFTGNTIVQVSGGQMDDEFQLYDNSGAFFTGGNIGDDLVVADNAFASINGLTVGDTVEAEGSSFTGIFNGSFGALEAVEDAMIVMLDGTVDEAVIAVLGGQVNVGAAQIGSPEVIASLNGSVQLAGTEFAELTVNATAGGTVIADQVIAGPASVESVGSTVSFDGFATGDLTILADVESSTALANGESGIINLAADGASDATVAGVTADALNVFANNESTVSITSGLYATGDLEARNGSVITIFGSNFSALGIPLNAGPVPFVAGNITGLLEDGSPFDFTFRRDFALDNAATILLVPEPASTVLLLTAFAVATRTRRRS